MMGDVKRALGPLCGLPALGQSAKTNHNTVYQTTTGTDVTLNATLTSLCRMWPLLFFFPSAAVRVRARTCGFFFFFLQAIGYFHVRKGHFSNLSSSGKRRKGPL